MKNGGAGAIILKILGVFATHTYLHLGLKFVRHCAKFGGSATTSLFAESSIENFAPLRDPFPGDLGPKFNHFYMDTIRNYPKNFINNFISNKRTNNSIALFPTLSGIRHHCLLRGKLSDNR